ncbi:LacI family DNA-binding transcriptional regulator [Rhizobium leguminosarum]|uniref:LacI family DNA-binding transcriptional regulator n=1 Tax=Rhizobium leguminosarum TaxID=384 RepID=A0A179BC89_RHILE|nr:LacI family DNA-binding transcriptional regulator [Rhizobium leguminosarum]MBY5437734.1 substrate-binding domain-containing protein [Rhizobium leguminosarum]NEI37981.1 LacI family DNA-binding transcriptional regulator [Rhizobium leguminosarum]NEI44688.1 LacI family DNA-binding transcriptional regulator [Rhizobium leguminosarum]OAP88945.1 LacI family transcriptional regulator [Rhizobium leguminosarum]
MRKPKTQKRNRPVRVTMMDIAAAAGCSQAAVSFVLNDTPGTRISQQTRDRVLEAARALGYMEKTYTTKASYSGLDNVIGFAVDQLATSPEAIVAIEGARQASWNAGNVLLVTQTLSDPVMEPKAIEALTNGGISALIYMTIYTRQVEMPSYVRNLNIPTVLLNCYTADHAFPAVVPSEIAGGQSSTRHLIMHGHHRIATITGEIWMQAAQDRLTGYRRALATADIPFDQELVIEGDWSASAGYASTMKLLALKEPPTAIFCQNDRTAIGCYEALKDAGLRIPQDMSVVGYDDEEISRHLVPPLTTSVLPHLAMGQWAIEHLNPENVPGKRYPIAKLECSLVKRHSVAAPRAEARQILDGAYTSP